MLFEMNFLLSLMVIGGGLSVGWPVPWMMIGGALWLYMVAYIPMRHKTLLWGAGFTFAFGILNYFVTLTINDMQFENIPLLIQLINSNIASYLAGIAGLVHVMIVWFSYRPVR